jgi:DtxR family Mn-dependent transcriptional regulator
VIAKKYEEALEAVWTCEEDGEHTADAIRSRSHAAVDEELLADIEARGWIDRRGDEVLLTEEGRAIAAGVIRRHRLAERLLTDALKMTPSDIEKPACEFEHLLIPEVCESICTLLGHPRVCPHGLPIPPGPCCREAKDVIDMVAVTANRLDIGESARVAYILPRNHARLHKLMSFGIHPGVEIQLHQRTPAFVIRCEGTDIALEESILLDIFVWRKPPDSDARGPHRHRHRHGRRGRANRQA